MKIFEIGVGEYWQSRTSRYIGTDVECYLFEPNPLSFQGIKENLSHCKNFKLFNYALGEENKQTNFFIAPADRPGSSFLEGVRSPEAVRNRNSEKQLEKIAVEMRDIRLFDSGDIDVVLLDTEGSEFNILKTLVSRPKHIVIEMYSHGVRYVNPNCDEIIGWMKDNNYVLHRGLSPWPDKSQVVGEDFYYVKV